MPSTPPGPVLRPAVDADLSALQALARRTIDASYRSFLGDEAVDWFLGSGASDEHIAEYVRQGYVRCMEADGELVGFAILEGPLVDLMMVDVRCHRRGYGRFLLAHAEQELFGRYEEIRLESFAGNDAANAFYRACGWQPSGPVESEGPPKTGFTRRRLAA